MKTLAIVFVTLLCSGTFGYSQNRIHNWEIEKITSIQIEIKSSNNEKAVKLLKTRQEIDLVMSFLKNVEFSDLNGSSAKSRENKGEWRFKIIFQGQRDQVWLFDNFAFIGKTTFLIDKNVVRDFSKLLEKL